MTSNQIEVFIRRSEWGWSMYDSDDELIASGGPGELADLAEGNGWTWFIDEDGRVL